MAANKKHHYVPRFYLRHFTTDGRSLSLYNIGRELVIASANLKNQCYRDYMYGKDGSQEHNLGRLEGPLAKLLNEIVTSHFLPSRWSPTHESLCVLTLLQYARTAYTSDSLDESTDKMWKQVFAKDPRLPLGVLDNVRISNTDAANLAVTTMLRLYHLIMDLDYKLLLPHEGTEFITSDNPVVLYNQLLELEPMGSKTGLVSKGLQIFFPLSPGLLLVFFDRSTYAYAPRQLIVTTVPTRSDMNQINALQVVSALENVYFSSAAAADVYDVVKRARPMRRTSKATVRAFQKARTDGGTSQIIGSSRTDVRTNLSLTFVKLLKPAKRWLVERKTPGFKPVTAIRNREMVDDHELFEKAVEAKLYQPSEFLRFVREKYDVVA